jgi:RNA methyltransferase, TrmH family
VPDISSRQHSIVRAFKSAARGEDDRVLLDGWHLLHDAAANGIDIRIVAISGTPSSEDASLLDDLARHCNVFTVTTAVMDAISPVRTPAGVVAIAHPKTYALRDLLRPSPALVVVACDIQDPGNAGAIVRSAEAGGATGVVLAGISADPWGWKALRAAMGSTFRLPVMRSSDATRTCDELRNAGLRLVATVPRGGTAMHHVDLRAPAALILGGEGRGLDPELVSSADERLTIPMRSPMDSLNVAVSAALLVYEARRQRDG